jgi:hypothetical protein
LAGFFVFTPAAFHDIRQGERERGRQGEGIKERLKRINYMNRKH